jgi:ketosteroid isomerase-like protein
MTMARIVSVAVLCVSLCSALAGQRMKKEEEAVDRRITDTLHQMYEAERRKDLKFVFSHLADDFTEVAGNGGVCHRADIEAEWSNVALRDYKLSDCAFKLMTRDSAYLSCKMELDATYKGQPFPSRLRVTTVWTRHGGEWSIRFEQGTTIVEPSNSK